jgi:aromatic ring-opening dioxygenase catalytic subunit (LigB family)
MTSLTTRLPTYYLSHGGGPWPYLTGDFRKEFDVLEASLKEIPRALAVRPKAILMVSGHWEEPQFSVMTHERPPMVYDYSGFPEHTYHVQYSAPGAPALAARTQKLLGDAGISVHADPRRGFDHGTFAPLAAMYPKADVPVFQLSLRADYDPAAHLAVGRALAPLRDEGVLIIGSGLSYHNLRRFGVEGAKASAEFDAWLSDVLNAGSHSDPAARAERLKAWAKAPSARLAHPQEDHLIPLMVALGAAEKDASSRVYHEDKFFGGLTVSSWRFG